MNIVDGWLQQATHTKSPNYNERPVNGVIDLLVIHNISLPPNQFGSPYIEQFFRNCLQFSDHPYFETLRDVEVSAHFLIKRSGEIVQFVSCLDRAWHAGQSVFCGRENCNDFSLGIELEGSDDVPYEDRQYQALSELTRALQIAYPGLVKERIVGHSDIAPGRKTDPGPSFDWPRYLRELDPESTALPGL